MRTPEEPSARCTMNMTPMIDVVFQLIVVFLCSMKFRTLDQKVDAFLPEVGTENKVHKPPEFHPVLTVLLQRAGPGQPTRVALQGTRPGACGSCPIRTR